jgi:hypothetical protein
MLFDIYFSWQALAKGPRKDMNWVHPQGLENRVRSERGGSLEFLGHTGFLQRPMDKEFLQESATNHHWPFSRLFLIFPLEIGNHYSREGDHSIP